MKYRLAAVSAALVLAVSGCGNLPGHAPAPLQLNAEPRSFVVDARFAVQRGTDTGLARLHWTRSGGSDDWMVTAVTGQTLAHVVSGPGGVLLEQLGWPPVRAASLREISSRYLGIEIEPQWLADALFGRTPKDLPPGWKLELDDKEGTGAVQIYKFIKLDTGNVGMRFIIEKFEPLQD